MNWKRGFKRIVSVLAIVAAVVCGLIAARLPVARQRDARMSLASAQLQRQEISRLEEELAKAEEAQQTPGKISKSYQKVVEWVKERVGKSQTTDDPNQMLVPAISQSRQAIESERDKFLALEDEQKKNFWYNLSTAQLGPMVALYGLAGAAAGFLVGWLILWYGGFVVFMFIHWLALGFRDDEPADEPKK